MRLDGCGEEAIAPDGDEIVRFGIGQVNATALRDLLRPALVERDGIDGGRVIGNDADVPGHCGSLQRRLGSVKKSG